MGWLVALALLVPTDPPATAGDRFYLLLFGGQADRFQPRTAHTWATFVRTAVTPTGEAVAEHFTISWLPCQMPVKPLKLRPEPGRNYGLHETLDLMTTGRQELSLWGPWEVRPDWYAQAARYKSVLDSGRVKYQTLDRGDRRPDINHCVHAVTLTDPGLHEASKPIAYYGELITRRLANAMSATGLLVSPCVTHDWLLAALGLARYPVKRRTVNEPVLRFRR